MRWLISYRDPEREKNDDIKKKSDAILRRLEENNGGDSTGKSDGKGKIQKLVLNQYEQIILGEVVAPEDIPVTFEGRSNESSPIAAFY